MKVGKLPVASIVLIVIVMISFIMRHFYPSHDAMTSPFIDGAFFGAGFVYLLYYINIWVTAYTNNKKEAKQDPAA